MSLYTKVTDQIVTLLQQGTVPWIKPWSTTAGHNTPCNAVSGRAYSGINTLLLWASATHSYPTPRFLTFGQAQRLGSTVNLGEKGFKIYFVKQLPAKVTPEGDDDKRAGTMLREYTVFNIAQCSRLPDNVLNPEPPRIINHDRRCELADYFLSSTGARIIEGAGSAFYSPGNDSISLPGWNQFHNSDSFYDVAFHELTHWTGAKKRLDRDLKNRFGTQAYAAEELIAELGSSYLCAEFGFDTTKNSAAYIQSWIELLKSDNRAIFTAASKASKAADYLRQLALQHEDPQWIPTTTLPPPMPKLHHNPSLTQ